MSAKDEIKHDAKIMGWRYHEDSTRTAIAYMGDTTIQIEYTTNGNVHDGKKYTFYKANDLHLQATTGNGNKKNKVLAWLAGLN